MVLNQNSAGLGSPDRPRMSTGLNLSTHLLSKGRPLTHRYEASIASGKGDGSRRFGFGITVPATKTGDEPCGPGQRVRRVWIFAGGGAAFQTWLEGDQDADLLGGESIVDGANQDTVANAEQLQDVRGGDQGDESQPLKRLRAFDLARLDIQPLRFKRAEKLLDGPAPPVPKHDFQGFGCVFR